MLDMMLFRNHLTEVAEQLKKRGFELDTQTIQNLEQQRKQVQAKTEQLQNTRNQESKLIGQMKARGENVDALMEKMQNINQELAFQEKQLEEIQYQLNQIYLLIPNLLHESVPFGLSEEDNLEIRRYGTPKTFSFPVQDHTSLGEALDMMDFALAAKLTGTRFCVLKKDLVKLHRALIHFMIDMHVNEHGYEEIYVPYIVNEASLLGTSQLPKFADDQFKLEHEAALYLIPTAEVPVTNTVRDEILSEAQLPKRYVCHTPCFRKEAGAYGKDTRGMIRQHQFEKVELVWITHPEKSYEALEQLVSHAENILKRLELPYRVVSLCSGDIGFAAAKTYDLEVWLPSQDRYREISSCSNTESFQARRLQARFKDSKTKKNQFVHTLNGSGLAVGRTLVAIMENYQDEQGNIHIPQALQPYMKQNAIKRSTS